MSSYATISEVQAKDSPPALVNIAWGIITGSVQDFSARSAWPRWSEYRRLQKDIWRMRHGIDHCPELSPTCR